MGAEQKIGAQMCPWIGEIRPMLQSPYPIRNLFHPVGCSPEGQQEEGDGRPTDAEADSVILNARWDNLTDARAILSRHSFQKCRIRLRIQVWLRGCMKPARRKPQ
jgi:hypothetical protein